MVSKHCTIKDKITLSTPVICKMYDIKTRKTIMDWVAMGMPQISKGKYDLYEVVHWKRERDETEAGVGKDAKERYWRAKADNEEIKRDVSRKELISRTQIEPEWAMRVGELTKTLDGLKDKLPQILVGKTEKQMRTILTREFNAMRESYARTGKYTPKTKK